MCFNRLLRFIASAFMSATLPFALAHAETVNCTAITSVPYVITANGTYCLTGDVTTAMTTGYAIDIQADHVVLDFNGHRLGNGSAGLSTKAVGVHALNRKGLTIKNGIIRLFHLGIYLEDSSFNGLTSVGHKIEGIKFDSEIQYGMLAAASASLIRDNDVYGVQGTGATAIHVDGRQNKLIGNRIANSTGTGIAASAGDNNIIEGNDITGELAYGIYVSSSSGTAIIGNRLLNDAGVAKSKGITVMTSVRITVTDNRVASFDTGIYIDTPSGSGAFLNNLVVGATTGYSGGAWMGGLQCGTNYSY
jgi:parallel beta-helix repeat protein